MVGLICNCGKEMKKVGDICINEKGFLFFKCPECNNLTHLTIKQNREK